MRMIIRIFKIFYLCVFVLWELLIASLKVAYDVITPTHYAKPGVVLVPIDLKKEFHIFLLANIITLTPGSVTLGITKDLKFILVHGMFIDDPEKFKAGIKNDFESKIKSILEDA